LEIDLSTEDLSPAEKAFAMPRIMASNLMTVASKDETILKPKSHEQEAVKV